MNAAREAGDEAGAMKLTAELAAKFPQNWGGAAVQQAS